MSPLKDFGLSCCAHMSMNFFMKLDMRRPKTSMFIVHGLKYASVCVYNLPSWQSESNLLCRHKEISAESNRILVEIRLE